MKAPKVYAEDLTFWGKVVTWKYNLLIWLAWNIFEGKERDEQVKTLVMNYMNLVRK